MSIYHQVEQCYLQNLIQNQYMIKGRYSFIKGFGNNAVCVGFGSYGQVKLGKDSLTNTTVAIKIVNKIAKNQLLFHKELQHQKIIKLLDYQIDKEKQITYMILEYADDGTLFQKIRSNQLKKSQVKKYFKDICEAIGELHKRQIMHRDLKPQNVLLTSQGNAKLCDFGFAAFLSDRMTLCGTYEYMAPQMIHGRTYDYRIDIWALGVLLFEMISGTVPFKGNSPQSVLAEMKTKIFFSDKFSPVQVNLIKTILRVTPTKRPSIKEILSHQYFNESISTKNSLQQATFKPVSLKKCQTTTYETDFKKQNKTPHNSYPYYIPPNLNTNNLPQKQLSQTNLKKRQPISFINQTQGPNYLNNFHNLHVGSQLNMSGRITFKMEHRQI